MWIIEDENGQFVRTTNDPRPDESWVLTGRHDYPEWRAFWLHFADEPPINPATQSLNPATPVKTSEGWVQAWIIVNKTPEEIRQLVPVVTMNQFELGLHRTGDLEIVRAAIAEIGVKLR